MILHIEDDPDIAELARHVLRNASDHPLVWLNDGQLALDFVLKQGEYSGRADRLPHMILLDLDIPTVSGLDVLKQLKASSHTAHIPVIVLTSSEDASDVLKIHQYGADAYLVKPTDARLYSNLVREAVKAWAPARAVLHCQSTMVH